MNFDKLPPTRWLTFMTSDDGILSHSFDQTVKRLSTTGYNLQHTGWQMESATFFYSELFKKRMKRNIENVSNKLKQLMILHCTVVKRLMCFY